MIQIGSIVTLLGNLGLIYPGTYTVIGIAPDGAIILDIPGFPDGAYVDQQFMQLAG